MKERFLTRDERLALACVLIGMVSGALFVLAAQAMGEML